MTGMGREETAAPGSAQDCVSGVVVAVAAVVVVVVAAAAVGVAAGVSPPLAARGLAWENGGMGTPTPPFLADAPPPPRLTGTDDFGVLAA